MGGPCLAEKLLLVAMLAQFWLPDESGQGRVDRGQTVSQVAKVSHVLWGTSCSVKIGAQYAEGVAHDYRRRRRDHSLQPTFKCGSTLHMATSKGKMKAFVSEPSLWKLTLKWERPKLLKVIASAWNGYLELSSY